MTVAPVREGPDAVENGPSRDDARDHVVKNLYDVELAKLAFGRPDTVEGERRAAAAALEFSRRDADRSAAAKATSDRRVSASDPRETPVSENPPFARPGRSTADSDSDDDGDDRSRWTRTAAVVVAVMLAAIVATTIEPLLPTNPPDDNSLHVFAREATTEERDLRAQLQREGFRVNLTPRIIAEEEDALFVAYRLIVTSAAERPRSEICVLLADDLGFGWPTCKDQADFGLTGLQTTLSGHATRYVLQWGPTGPPTVSALRAGAVPPAYPESAVAQSFFADPPGQDGVAYAGLLRTLHPDDRLIVRVLGMTANWEAVGALVSSVDTELWSYCVHLFQRTDDRSGQLGSSVTCAGADAFDLGGLVAQVRSVDTVLRLVWQPDGIVHMEELPQDGA